MVPIGTRALKLLFQGAPLAAPIEVEILEPRTLPPTIQFVGNAVDGGTDVVTKGDKSVIRVLVRDLDLDATPFERVRVRFNNVLVTPTRVEFVASHAMHMIVARLPDTTRPGLHEVVLVAGATESPGFRFKVSAVGTDPIGYWHRRVLDVLTETGEMKNPWVAPHARRYAFSLAELEGLDAERNVAFEIGLTRLFPFLLTSQLGYRRILGTHFEPGQDQQTQEVEHAIFGQSVRVTAFNVDLEHDRIPMADASVDLVLCCEVLEHMDVDPMFMLAEINRITKPGGHLFLTTPNISSARAVWKILNGYAPHFFMQYQRDRSPHRHNYEHDIHSLQVLTRAAGFETCVLKTIDVFEAPEPRGLLALNRLSMTTAFRGDDIFFIGRKVGVVTDRWPAGVYV